MEAYASSAGVENMTKLKLYIEQALEKAPTDLESSKKAYDQYHDQWLTVENTIKSNSLDAYRDIETQMGQVEYAYITNKVKDVQNGASRFGEFSRRLYFRQIWNIERFETAKLYAFRIHCSITENKRKYTYSGSTKIASGDFQSA